MTNSSDATPPGSSGGPLPGLAVTRKTVREHWRLFLLEGVVLIVLGAGAIVLPTIAGLAATIFFGWLLLIDRGADIGKTDFTGRSALDWAKQTGKQSIIELLTKAGAK